MDILLIAGFLGAGKTTMIRHLLTFWVKGAGKVAVIVNEFGKIGIDGELLSTPNVSIIELANGCICCTIKTDFSKAIQDIYHRGNPSFLIVEASGVSQPSDILDAPQDLSADHLANLRNIITVVDADFFKVRGILGPFYENQIQCADILIVNKIDLVGDEILREIKRQIHKINPNANLVFGQHCAIDLSVLLGEPFENQKRGRRYEIPTEYKFQTFSYEDSRLIDEAKMRMFLEGLPANIFRCKGWVKFTNGSFYLDFTSRRYRFEPSRNQRDTALSFIGRNCDEKQTLNDLKKCFYL